MSRKSVRVIVFDYDGTLVDSNAIKKNAYRPLFPAGRHFDRYVADALRELPLGTRFDIIEDILKRADEIESKSEFDAEVERIAREYDYVVTEGAAMCPERPGATRELESLSLCYPIYLLSVTVETSLKKIINRRNWNRFFKKIIGYPCDKKEVLLAIAQEENVDIEEILMVGDGEVDRLAAEQSGSQLLFFNDDTPMTSVKAYLDV